MVGGKSLDGPADGDQDRTASAAAASTSSYQMPQAAGEMVIKDGQEVWVPRDPKRPFGKKRKVALFLAYVGAGYSVINYFFVSSYNRVIIYPYIYRKSPRGLDGWSTFLVASLWRRVLFRPPYSPGCTVKAIP